MANRILQCLQVIAMPVSFLLFFIFIQQVTFGQTSISSNQSGLWDLTSTWSGYTVPGVNDNVIVDDEITIRAGTTVEVNDLIISKKGVLTIEGTLILNGNLTMVNNDPEFRAGSDANVIIRGNANISNKVNINLSSYFIVLGDFTIGGGGATDINIANASIYVFGTFDGGSTTLEICTDYDNNTDDYNNEMCHIGTEDAFNTNEEEGQIPVDIIDLVLACDASVTISVDATTICEGEDAVFALSGTSGATVYYNINGGANQSVVLSGGVATIIIKEAYENQTLELVSVDDGTCSKKLSETTTVVVNPLPNTGDIIPD